MQIDRKICFPKDRPLRILQVSDAQDMHFVRRALPEMLNAAYDTLQPDLIVLTGDNIHGNHLDEDRLGKSHDSIEFLRRNMRKAIAYIMKPIEKRGIPVCMIFGNHDDMNAVSKQEQADMFKAYSCFFGLNSDEETLDCDTYNVPIYSSDGERIAFNLWMLDSAGKDDGTGKGFSYVKPAAIDWYKRTSAALRAQNGGEPVPSLMFQHVPVPQTTSLFIPCDADDPDAVRWQGPDKTPYKLDTTKADGYAAEYPDVCEADFGQLDAIREAGDVLGLVFGHDHANNFTATLEGVPIIQTPGASFRSYGTERARGVRMFEIDEKDPQHFETYTVGYYDLVGKSLKTKWSYFMSADEFDYKRAVIFGSAAAVAVAGTTAGLLIRHFR